MEPIVRAESTSKRQETVTYTYKLQILDIELGAIKFGHFPSGLNDNCEISLGVRRKASTGIGFSTEECVDIVIEKTNPLPTEADLTLTIEQSGLIRHQFSQSLINWKESHCLHDRSVLSSVKDAGLHTITLKIKWTISDSLFLNKSSMSYIKLSDFALSPCFSDVTIVIDDERIPAHKVILGAASPVLLSMLTSPMKEAADNCIVIRDIEVDVMKAVLKVLYNGKNGDLEEFEMALKALSVAEKYDMAEIKSLCERTLLRNLTTENALQILDQADTYQAETLKQKCMKFVIDHRSVISGTAYFDEIFVRKPLLMKQFTMGVIQLANKLVVEKESIRRRDLRDCSSSDDDIYTPPFRRE